MEALQNDENTPAAAADQPMSKNAQKRLLKQQRFEAKKAEKKAQMKEHKKKEAERKRREWEEKLASLAEEEREKLIEERKGMRKERMEKRSEERGKKMERLQAARINGQKVVIDLEFAHLMASNELHSLVQQIMYCYAINGRCALPAHIWLTGCQGEMHNQLLRIPGYDKWAIEKEEGSYVDAFKDQKENLVYLTADSENVLDELDPKSIYIIGGLVDRNRWKGITMKKAEEQGIKTAKLPIGTYLKMSSSQVLTVNQVVEILLKFLETKDWKDSFFQVIPLRKRCEAGPECSNEEFENEEAYEEEDEPRIQEEAEAEADNEDGEDDQEVGTVNIVGIEDQKAKRQCTET
ncbi:tRNA (guanine(9)-n1)-methyltransferase [Phtheirospermum japonicum]|uniref:tRNA (guanine(9)-N(1))-methyltransferase n=1 Tax=Phtheirospermum japonicum TaxID=374723 RepID=A0A830C330_9LAMI|nr:tRNA (guanine(9)-n1)-methyltransferase [Phtheirospermum japonicum]